MRRKQLEQSLQSTQRDGILTVDQALVKQAWERVSNTVRDPHLSSEYKKKYEDSGDTIQGIISTLLFLTFMSLF